MSNYKIFFTGCFFILSIYHLFVYIGRRKDASNLIFAIYCLSVVNVFIAGSYYNKYPENFFTTYYYVFSFHLIGGMLPLFTYFSLDFKNTKIAYVTLFSYIFVTIYLFILTLISYIINNKSIINFYFPALMTICLLFIIAIIQKYIIPKKYKDIKSITIMLGLLILILYNVILLFLLGFKIIIPSFVTYLVLLTQALFFAFSLTYSFNQEHHDLIDLKNTLEKKVEDRTLQLEEAQKQKTNFFVNIAHETKTPLTLISNYLDKYLKKHNREDDILIIKNNIDKLKKDMINFLDMQKLERGQIFYNHNQIINLSYLLNEKINLFTEAAWKNRIKIIPVNIKNNIMIKIDPYAVDRVINNLMDNAIKYNREYGKVEVSLIEKNDKIIFTIKDTGIGISKEQQENIFNPYHQISYEKRNIQGIGMGLNIVKNIINDVNGSIEINSELDKGTAFIITFNKYLINKNEIITDHIKLSKPFKSIVYIKLKEETYDDEKENILIIEDNIEMLAYLQDNFYDDYNVFITKNGIEALKRIAEIPKPNIIISDIMMDKMNGYEFYDELMKNEIYNDIPFIFLTALTSNNDKIEGLKKGAVDYIYKPFTIEELQNKVKSLIKIQHNQKNNNLTTINNKIQNILYEDYNKEDNKINIDTFYLNKKINKKEQDIIILLIEGLKYSEISSRLNLSIYTVTKYIHRIYKKLNVKNNIELVNKIKS